MANDQGYLNKWLRAEVGAAFAVGLAVAGIMIYFTTPINSLNTQIAVINNQISELKSNDLVHIELQVTNTSARLDDLQKQLIENTKTLEEILVLVSNKAKP